jgi:hypothetical protein
MKHLVVQDVRDYVGGNFLPIKPMINHYEIQGGVKAAELRSPRAPAPTQSWLRKRVVKILVVELTEERFEIVASAGGAMLELSCAPLPQSQQSTAG